MTGLRAAWAIEVRKAARSGVPAVTLAVFTLAPGIGALFMFIIADPVRARRFGLLNQKAQLSGLNADWPGMLAFAAQVVAVGSLILFAFIATWLFGCEFTDGTARYLMALPVPRTTIVTAKLTLFTVWAALLTLWLVTVTLLLGWLMGLPGWTTAIGLSGVVHALSSGALMIPAIMPIAYIASRTRAYLPALAAAMGLVALAQITAVLGWAAYLPWSIPAIAAGLVPGQHLEPISVAISLAAGAVGAGATLHWWRSPDAGL
jgi:ABC-2 type transport system permease protein